MSQMTQTTSGKEKLMVGNGSKLFIAHTRMMNLPSLNKKVLKLKNVMHVPSIKKNSLSVSQLAFDNNVFIEFQSECCFVKDKETGQVLLQGMLKDGLYQLTLPNQSKMSIARNNLHVLFASSISNSHKDLWHRRFGHPSNKILFEILRSCHQSMLINKNISFCDACQYGKSHSLPFSISTYHAKSPLELIHSDLWDRHL